LIFFLALLQKETKKSSPFKPIRPQKPKFPAIAQGLESRPFWLPAIRRPGKRTGPPPFQPVKLIQTKNILLTGKLLIITVLSLLKCKLILVISLKTLHFK
jgi:hypothetical protein